MLTAMSSQADTSAVEFATALRAEAELARTLSAIERGERTEPGGPTDNVIGIVGAPGAGKGTQAGLLAARLGITHISSGDLLRQHVRDMTSLGQLVKSYVDKGDLVPDGLVMDMLRKPVVAAAKSGGYVLDGFPRTVEQAEASYAVVREFGGEVQAAVHLDVTRDELVRRLLARGRGSDDTRAVIEHRLQVYLEKTVPLLEYYAGREWMFVVDGALPADAVHQDIVRRIQRLAAFSATSL